MENRPGNGYSTPFGNEQGATASAGPASGAHDFLTDPKGHGSSAGGRDFTKENRPQPMGAYPCRNEESVPAGGDLPFPAADPKGMAGPDGVALSGVQPSRKPFRLGGEGAAPAPMAGELPADEY